MMKVQNNVPRRRSRMLEFTLGVLGLAAVSLIFVPWQNWESVVTQIPFLRLAEIHVSCAPPLTEAKVLSWLPNLKGRNILLVKASSLMKVLREKPWVDSVVIKKEYPSRLFIDISTKRARALKVVRGNAVIVDSWGREIEKATPAAMLSLDLPVISAENQVIEDQWDLSEVIRVLETSQKSLGQGHPISQVMLSAYPYFRIYLSNPSTELTLSLETWEAQLPRAALLLQHPPRELLTPRKINLVLAKKAIVSSQVTTAAGKEAPPQPR